MYCSTCGAYVPAGRSACTECGSQVALRPPRSPAAVPRFGSEDRRWIAEPLVGICPRCSYRGESISYFSRGSHVALLVGITLITGGMMGIGGVLYYLARRDHRICARCGRSWGREGELALVPRHGAMTRAAGAPPAPVASGSGKRIWSIVLFVLAAMLLIVGIVEVEAMAALFGAMAAGGGYLLHRAANEERAARRIALLTSLQQPVLKLAAERRGRLTVTEVATALGWSLPRAEKVLESLNDGLRVDSEVTDEGVIVYEFRELLQAPDRRRLPEAGS